MNCKLQIKFDLDWYLKNNKVILELGCGTNKTEGRIGIDQLDLPGVDIVADLNQGFAFLPDHCVDEMHSRSFFEHIDDLGYFMKEILRVLKPSGKCYLFVPHFSNPFYYSDYTHKNFIGLYTFYYFVDTKYQPSRKVPCFYTDTRIVIDYIHMSFYSSFRYIKFFKKILEKIINFNFCTMEFYEENLCYLIPCYGLTIIFSPDTNKNT